MPSVASEHLRDSTCGVEGVLLDGAGESELRAELPLVKVRRVSCECVRAASISLKLVPLEQDLYYKDNIAMAGSRPALLGLKGRRLKRLARSYRMPYLVSLGTI